jgi:hypothetical protein
MKRPHPAVTVVALSLVAAPLVAQSPWTAVPALPTACYQDRDQFQAQLITAVDANQAALARQEQVNASLQKGLDSNMAGKQAAMMAYMQKDQAGFQAYMQDIAMNPESLQTATAGRLHRLQAFQTEFDSLKGKYDAEQKSTLDPLAAEVRRMADPGTHGTPAQLASAVAKYNAAYESLCQRWIVQGNFPGFLARFKHYMTEDYVPGAMRLDAKNQRSLTVMGVNTREYQSTAPMEAAGKYMDYTRIVFGLRPMKPMNTSL